MVLTGLNSPIFECILSNQHILVPSIIMNKYSVSKTALSTSFGSLKFKTVSNCFKILAFKDENQHIQTASNFCFRSNLIAIFYCIQLSLPSRRLRIADNVSGPMCPLYRDSTVFESGSFYSEL